LINRAANYINILFSLKTDKKQDKESLKLDTIKSLLYHHEYFFQIVSLLTLLHIVSCNYTIGLKPFSTLNFYYRAKSLKPKEKVRRKT